MAEPTKLDPGAGDEEVRVVVVEDDGDSAWSLAYLLELSGYKVFIARDGLAALAVIGECKPHCVLLDIGIPGIDGNELSRRLRELHGDDMILIAVTGRDADDRRVGDTFARVDHYLQKPVDAEVLRKVLPPVRG